MRARLAAYVLLAALVLLLPAVAGPFLRYLVLNMLLLALSFNLLFGMTGLLSFGQGAFYAGGAYTAALLLRAGAPLLWSILLGAIAAEQDRPQERRSGPQEQRRGVRPARVER